MVRPKGIHCPIPACCSRDVTPQSWYKPTPGRRVRYFVCNACKGRFRTTERLDGPVKKRKLADGRKAS